MTKTVIKVENLSKQYRLGQVGTGTLSHDLNRWWARVRGKEDPFKKVTATNDRTVADGSEYVWALKDINFEVKKGEILGIIGKNGAGKSTLLKILSKVTGPSTGTIKTKGRIASLLEVGTGFHPEMTGRENIFMNGTLNGMNRHEIRAKLDEIVDFAGVAKYLDTPTKRYSSGMTVRLGFAVAAFLEPEILVVDEVLAVGDAEFQNKAIGKMQNISAGEGRTVLFVSHNLSSIRQLCSLCLLMHNGNHFQIDDTNLILSKYAELNSTTLLEKEKDLGHFKRKKNLQLNVRFTKISLNNSTLEASSELRIHLMCHSNSNFSDFLVAIAIKDQNGVTIYHISNKDLYLENKLNKGENKFTFQIPQLGLKVGYYFITIFLSISDIIQDWLSEIISFRVEESTIYPVKVGYKNNGIVQPVFEFIKNK